MKKLFTNGDLGEIYSALEVQADAAHDEWRETKGRERISALRYKKKIARLLEKVERILKEKNDG